MVFRFMPPPNQTAPASSNYPLGHLCLVVFRHHLQLHGPAGHYSYLKEFFCTPAEQGGSGWSNTDFAYLTSFFTGVYASMTGPGRMGH